MTLPPCRVNKPQHGESIHRRSRFRRHFRNPGGPFRRPRDRFRSHFGGPGGHLGGSGGHWDVFLAISARPGAGSGKSREKVGSWALPGPPSGVHFWYFFPFFRIFFGGRFRRDVRKAPGRHFGRILVGFGGRFGCFFGQRAHEAPMQKSFIFIGFYGTGGTSALPEIIENRIKLIDFRRFVSRGAGGTFFCRFWEDFGGRWGPFGWQKSEKRGSEKRLKI